MFQWTMKLSSARSRSSLLSNDPRRSAFLLRIENQHSIDARYQHPYVLQGAFKANSLATSMKRRNGPERCARLGK